MRYLATLHGDETVAHQPGTPEFDETIARYIRFGETAGSAIVTADALQPSATVVTVRAGDGDPLVTAGPFIESTEAIGGMYVLEADTLDDAIELARQIPAALTGGIQLRPLVEWFEAGGDQPGDDDHPRYLALIYGKETEADVPGTPAWDEGAAAHGRFAEKAGAALRAGGALHPASTTTTVRVRDGEMQVTDGPYVETAEVVGGLYLFNRLTRDEATALAAQIPVGPGGGVELRPIMEVGA